MKKWIFVWVLFMLLGSACANSVEKNQTTEPSNDIDTKVELEDSKQNEKEAIEENTLEQTEQVTEDQKTQTEQATVDQNAASLGLVAATVARVVDGDTFVLSDGQKVRIVGVNTPESTTRHEEFGKEASNYTSTLLTGKQIWLQKDVSETDRYSRLLRIVWLEVPTNVMDENEIRAKMFNAQLVLNGYAEPSTYPPDVKYSDYFVQFAREARANQTGLWAFGENGTTKGDLDQTTSSSTNTNQNQNTNKTPETTEKTESFANCSELRKVYPNGVPSTHSAYQPKMDRDKDNFACEQ